MRRTYAQYYSTQNVVIHTENCKLELPLNCSTTQMKINIRRMCGIEESSRRSGFADFAIKVFYIVQERQAARLPSACFSLFII